MVLWGNASQWCSELTGFCPVAASWQTERERKRERTRERIKLGLLGSNEGIKTASARVMFADLFLTTQSKPMFDWLVD